MAPLESELIQKLGLGYLVVLIKLSTTVFFYGVFVLLFSASVVIFVRRGFSNRATAAMFVATVIDFLLSSLNTGTSVSLFIVFIQKALVLDIDYSLPEKREFINNVLRNANLVTLWVTTLPIWLSDLIVVWRAWALFEDRRSVVLLPFIMWLGTVGIFFGFQTWLSSVPKDYDQTIGNGLDSSSIASITLSTSTNAVTTMMIAYKLWSHRRFATKTLGLSRRKSPVQTVLILLVDSGLVYRVSVFLVLATIPNTSLLSLLATDVFNQVYFSLAPIYPTAVVILVETQRSMTDVYEISPSNASQLARPVASGTRPATLGHPSFRVGSVYSTTDNEAESQRSRALRSQGGQEYIAWKRSLSK